MTTTTLAPILTEEPPIPPHFGIARTDYVGSASHELIYEYEYNPRAVRKFSTEKPEVCSGLLRPAIRSGRVDFRFFGCRIPLTGDHARCWVGHIFLNEMKLGRLQRAELLVLASREPPPAKAPGPLHRHGPQHPWLWHVWPVGRGIDRDVADPPVEVTMLIDPHAGISLEVTGENEAARCFVFRMLRQYCDDDDGNWHPTPEATTAISKVHDRAIPPEQVLKRVIGGAVPEPGSSLLDRSVGQLHAAEQSLVQAIGRAEVTGRVAKLKEMMIYVGEVQKALQFAHEVRFRLKRNYNDSAGQLLEALLKKAIAEAENTEDLHAVRDLAHSMCNLGVHEPPSLLKIDMLLSDDTALQA